MQTFADLPQQQQWPCGLPSEPMQYTRPSLPSSERASSVEHFVSAFDVLAQQISGSLQNMKLAEPPRVLPSNDPYHTPPTNRTVFVVPSLSVGFGVQHFHRFEGGQKEAEVFLTARAATAPKTVASFVGRVESLIGDSASVILVNEQTGEHLESRCDTAVLRENGIGAGDEFRCEVLRSKGTTTTHLFRLQPKALSKERLDQIRAAFKNRWTF